MRPMSSSRTADFGDIRRLVQRSETALRPEMDLKGMLKEGKVDVIDARGNT
jgi:hypothetical protein